MNEQDQQRKIRHRVAVLRHAAEVTGNVAQTSSNEPVGARRLWIENPMVD